MDRLVALPGTLCPPGVFDRLAAETADAVSVDAVSWLTEPGPWDVPSVAERVAARIGDEGPVLLAGHSTGGAIALQLTITRPDLVRGLLLMDTGAHMQGHGDVRAIIDRIAADWGADLRAAVLDRSFHHGPDDQTRVQWLAWAAAVDRQAALEVLTSQAALDLRPGLGAIDVPVELVHGVHDRARRVEDARELAAAIQGAELTLLPVGHSPMYEAPAEVAAAVRRLTQRVRRRAVRAPR
ncbi:alpha/beta fold hydrolase [Tsukamurella soli]|uniref:AB hydrolase-1 domain-containing protein n=1 Tax=Tsukamurella soli TaxID=644556 RepID=A0ABP8KAI5_9ACTN